MINSAFWILIYIDLANRTSSSTWEYFSTGKFSQSADTNLTIFFNSFFQRASRHYNFNDSFLHPFWNIFWNCWLLRNIFWCWKDCWPTRICICCSILSGYVTIFSYHQIINVTISVLIVNIQVALDTSYWTAINHFFIWASILFYFAANFSMFSNGWYTAFGSFTVKSFPFIGKTSTHYQFSLDFYPSSA